MSTADFRRVHIYKRNMKTVFFLIFKFLLTIQVIIVIFEIFHSKDLGVEKYSGIDHGSSANTRRPQNIHQSPFQETKPLVRLPAQSGTPIQSFIFTPH